MVITSDSRGPAHPNPKHVQEFHRLLHLAALVWHGLLCPLLSCPFHNPHLERRPSIILKSKKRSPEPVVRLNLNTQETPYINLSNGDSQFSYNVPPTSHPQCTASLQSRFHKPGRISNCSIFTLWRRHFEFPDSHPSPQISTALPSTIRGNAGPPSVGRESQIR